MSKKRELYTVEKILMRRTNPKSGQIEYKIKWQGYSYAECTWEPFYNLQYVIDMVDQFNREQEKNSKDKHKTHKIRKFSSKEESSSESIQQKKDKIKPAKEKLRVKKYAKVAEVTMAAQTKPLEDKKKKIVVKEQMPKQQPKESDQPIVVNEGAQEVQNVQNDDYSDLQDEVQVIEIAEGEKGEYYFQVKFPQEIKWISHSVMRSQFRLELINFYEKYMTFTNA